MHIFILKDIKYTKKTLRSITENLLTLCLKLMLRTFFISSSYLLEENH